LLAWERALQVSVFRFSSVMFWHTELQTVQETLWQWQFILKYQILQLSIRHYSWFHITFPRMLRTSFRTSLWSSKVHTEIHKPVCKQSLWLVP
jgi:hypothetical protein